MQKVIGGPWSFLANVVRFWHSASRPMGGRVADPRKGREGGFADARIAAAVRRRVCELADVSVVAAMLRGRAWRGKGAPGVAWESGPR
jgi:hypothetical protein